MKKIIFNDWCTTDDGIIIVSSPDYVINNSNFEEVKTGNRNGDYIINEDEYTNTELQFKLGILSNSKDDFFQKLDNIVFNLNCNLKENKLTFEREDVYYPVKKIVFGKITNKFYLYGELDVKFICGPFRYAFENYIELINNSNLYYQGNVEGEPNIKIYGSGNIQLTINDETVQINNVNEYVELDSKLLLCLNKDKTSKSRDMIGHFHLLSQGSNAISWVGNVSKVEILPRTAYK